MKASPPPSGPFHSVLLVGFMCSGKSSVGRRLAALMGWEFVDVDALVEEHAGRTVDRIFHEDGEEAFRRLEEQATGDALRVSRRVVAPGGGWAAAGRLESVDPAVLTVWLKVDAVTAVERAAADPGTRPLLAVPDPVSRAEQLLGRREPFYREARLHMDTAGETPERLAEHIVRFLREGGRAA